MAQHHTQPVAPQQQQQQTQQQQQQPQHSTSTTPQPNNNNVHTSNNQTQTMSIQQQQQQQQNNNSLVPAQTFTPVSMHGGANQPIYKQPALYMPAPGVHHQQYHPAMIPAQIPSNVYVNNVTANVNLHGWPHTVPAYIPASAAQHYIHSGDMSTDQNAPVMQQMTAMPIALAPPPQQQQNNALTGPGGNQSTPGMGGGRGSRRGRGGRGNNSSGGSRRSDYNSQRHPHPEGSPAPQPLPQQQQQQLNQEQMQQQQQQQQQQLTPQQHLDASQMMPAPHTYAAHPQYAHAAYAPYTPGGYYFAPQNHMIHPSQSAAAQQATGPPLYVSSLPIYNGNHVYNYMGGYIYPPVLNPAEYHQYVQATAAGSGEDGQSGDERGPVGGVHDAAAMMPQYYHPQHMYATPEEYGGGPVDHTGSVDDINHNNPSMGSVDSPTGMLSPGYPIYDAQMHEMQQQMSVMQIYEDPQMGGHMQGMHAVQQLDDDLSECGGTIQMLPPGAIITTAAGPMQMQPNEPPQMLHHVHPQQQPPHHLIQAIPIGMEPQHLQHLQQQPDGELVIGSEIENLQSCESVTNLHEVHQQSTENISAADDDYLQQQQHHQQHQHEQQQAALNANDGYSSKILMTDPNELNENVPNIEVITTNAVEQLQPQQLVLPPQQQQQPQMYHHQQQPQHEEQQQIVPQQQQQQQQTQTHPQQEYHQQANYQHQHEQRKQPQAYSINNQQQSRRKYSSEYNMAQHQQHQQPPPPHVPNNNNNNSDSSIQTTKSMSWTNSSQHKKSTASVAVTATPAAAAPSSNKHSNAYSHSTRTYTNQQHHYQNQQQHYHQQQQQQHYQQPQMRHYGVMKMPSSPIATTAPPLERKNSQTEQSKSGTFGSTASNASNPGTTGTTSTASTTAAPHLFPTQHSFAYKKSAAAATTTVATQIAPAAPTPQQPTMNMAPPASAVPAPSGSPSWASLFANKGSTISSNISSSVITTSINNAAATVVAAPAVIPIATAPAVTNAAPTSSVVPAAAPSAATVVAAAASVNIIASPALPPPFSSKKPIAKVAPYEGLTPVTPAPPVVTPGAMSYSAASAQGIPAPAPAAARPAAVKAEPNRAAAANLDEWTQKFADFLVKQKTDLTPISLRPRGLTNRSNYCYINSILQALLGCSPFYQLMRSIPRQAAALSEVKTPTVNAMISFMSNFSSLPAGMRMRTTNKGPKGKDDLGGDLQCDTAFEPTEIYKLWNDSREEHVEGRQEDAEEFLGYVLNKLNDEMLEVIKLIAKPSTVEQNGPNDQSESEEGDVWQMICNNRNKGSVTRQTDFGRTPLSDIFRGELRSRLQREGEHSTDVIQPFFTLQLNIEKAASVKEALEILVGRDQLEGVTGSKSKQEVVAWQQMTLEKLPVVLILHLKWFDYRSDGCTKILKKVEFPVELKIDAKILASKKYSQKQRAYRLFAVVYHDGKEASKGHYITDVYHTGYGSWLRYDDSSVKPVSENHVLLPRTPRVPYLLYYRRCDTVPPQQQAASATGNSAAVGTGGTTTASPSSSTSSTTGRDVK